MDGSWVFRLTPRKNAGLRLVCFPHAGRGASMFNAWSRELPDTIEVCAVALPGREGRILEPSITAMPELVAKLVVGLEPILTGPFVFFGHSVGALVAFELTRELRRLGKALPARLLLAGRRAPQCPPLPQSYQLNDRDFLGEIARRYGELPAPVRDSPDILAMFLTILRADMTLVDTYRYREEPPLAVPIVAYGGTRDETVPLPMVEAWQEHTTAPFRSRSFEGDHFFPDALRPKVVAAVRDDVECQFERVGSTKGS